MCGRWDQDVYESWVRLSVALECDQDLPSRPLSINCHGRPLLQYRLNLPLIVNYLLSLSYCVMGICNTTFLQSCVKQLGVNTSIWSVTVYLLIHITDKVKPIRWSSMKFTEVVSCNWSRGCWGNSTRSQTKPSIIILPVDSPSYIEIETSGNITLQCYVYALFWNYIYCSYNLACTYLICLIWVHRQCVGCSHTEHLWYLAGDAMKTDIFYSSLQEQISPSYVVTLGSDTLQGYPKHCYETHRFFVPVYLLTSEEFGNYYTAFFVDNMLERLSTSF